MHRVVCVGDSRVHCALLRVSAFVLFFFYVLAIMPIAEHLGISGG